MNDLRSYTMNIRKFSALAVVALSMVSAAAHAQMSTWTIDPAHSSIQFTIRHLGVSNVHGTIAGVKGTVVYDEKDVSKSNVTATMDTTTVNTGNDARDKHLKSPDFFDADKNPTITFKSTAVTKAGGKLQLVGDLTLNGVTKSVTLDLDGPAPAITQRGKTVSGFSASGSIKRADFNFGAKFSAPMLGDDVKIVIDVEIDKQ
jgi:polyisoprenoid-binding protein YceI